MALIDWTSLPSIVIVEILSRLPHNDRLNASSVCKSWRKCLFFAPLWSNFVFKVNISSATEERLKAQFLTEKCAKFVRQADIHFVSSLPVNVNIAVQILETLCTNPNIQYLKLCPASGRLEHQERSVICRYVNAVKTLIKCSRKLQGIAFGCIEEIIDSAEDFLRKLSQYHSKTLRCLYIASVKENPENYKLLNISPLALTDFTCLQKLSLDYDYLCDALLENLAQPDRTPLIKLDIHIHGLSRERQPILDQVWRQLCDHSPNLEISLTLLHSPVAANLLTTILQPSMRLVRYSQYFCSTLNVSAINFIADTYSSKFQSMCIIDSMENFQAEFYHAPEEDPFVMLAWRCERLTELTLIGYTMAVDDLIAIARLRGKQLTRFKVPDCCIEYREERIMNYTRLTYEVSKWLQQPWGPVNNEDLHQALINWQVDAVGVYMPTIFAEQTW